MACSWIVAILTNVAAGTVGPAVVLGVFGVLAFFVLVPSRFGLCVDFCFKLGEKLQHADLDGIMCRDVGMVSGRGHRVISESGRWHRGGVGGRCRVIDTRCAVVVVIKEGFHDVDTRIGVAEGGGSVDDGEVGVTNFEFGLGFNDDTTVQAR